VQVITGGWVILAVLFAIFQFVQAFFAY